MIEYKSQKRQATGFYHLCHIHGKYISLHDTVTI